MTKVPLLPVSPTPSPVSRSQTRTFHVRLEREDYESGSLGDDSCGVGEVSDLYGGVTMDGRLGYRGPFLRSPRPPG